MARRRKEPDGWEGVLHMGFRSEELGIKWKLDKAEVENCEILVEFAPNFSDWSSLGGLKFVFGIR